MTDDRTPRERAVTSGGIRLAVRTTGDERAPTVVLIHGFPDTMAVWEPVVALLRDELQVVTYDVRGAGRSSAPRARSGYELARLVDDLVAVIEATSPDRPIHLVGHDWGSVQGWAAIGRAADDARLTGRIASFTSMSGPSIPQFAAFVRRSARAGRWGVLRHQLVRSWYIAAFQVPWVPEAVFLTFGASIRTRLARHEGLPGRGHWASTFARDAANGVDLYRANRGGREPVPAGIVVPVQLIVPRQDAYISPAVFTGLETTVSDLRRVDVDGGHWLPRTHPEAVVEHVRRFVREHEPASP